MLLLVSTSDKLQVVTSAAVATDVHASWVDNSATAITPGRTNTAITTAATTDVVASPGAGTVRNIKTLNVRNKHTSNPCDVTIQHTDGTTVAQLYRVTLPAGYSLQYLENIGFSVLSPTVATAAVGFRATKGGTNQTSFAQDTNTKLTFTTEELDRGDYYDAPNSRWTPPAGFIHLTCTINFGGSAGGLGVFLGFAKNGVVQKLHYMTLGTGEGGVGGIEASFDDYAPGTDYYEAYSRFGGSSGGFVEGDITRSYFQGHIAGSA